MKTVASILIVIVVVLKGAFALFDNASVEVKASAEARLQVIEDIEK